MLPDPVTSPAAPASSGLSVTDLLEVLDRYGPEDRSLAIRLLLLRVTEKPQGISARQRNALSALLFALAQVTFADVALAEMDITPANAFEMLDLLRKLHVARDFAEREAAALVGSVEPATVNALVVDLAEFIGHASARSSANLLH